MVELMSNADLPQHWLPQLQKLLAQQQNVVMVTVISARGSTPRESGAKMLITLEESYLTIGGGRLEQQSIDYAQNLLKDTQACRRKTFTLGETLGQCCGGVVEVLFELFSPGNQDQTRNQWLQQSVEQLNAAGNSLRRVELFSGTVELLDETTARKMGCESGLTTVEGSQYWCEPLSGNYPQVIVFGAGHVGRELVHILQRHPLDLLWVDKRAYLFEPKLAVKCGDNPQQAVSNAPCGSYFIVMTHDHQLDLQLVQMILQRNDAAFCGLIGSRSKRMRFEHRLRDGGISAAQIGSLHCPLGDLSLHSKQPASIALSIAMQLLQEIEAKQNHRTAEELHTSVIQKTLRAGEKVL